jgi:hypothetical protein
MSSATLHSASRIRRVRRSGGVHVEGGRLGRAQSVPRLSETPLSDPADILPKMPAQAISPALLQLLDLMSCPILLIEDSPGRGPESGSARRGAAGGCVKKDNRYGTRQ